MNEQERAYNTPDFAIDIPDLERVGDTLQAKIGASAPDFAAQSLDGETFRLGDLRGKRHVVLMTGSITSPMCAFQIPAMNRLLARFKPRSVDGYLLYTRESHPGERYPHHTSLEQKFAYARDLRRLEDVQFPIVVDTLDGKAHQLYGAWPSALFVIHRDGRLVYRSNITNGREVEQFLEDLVLADSLESQGVILHTEYSERIARCEADQPTHHRVYERAGQKAFEDYWKFFPVHRNRWP